jgi:hypothetical protein
LPFTAFVIVISLNFSQCLIVTFFSGKIGELERDRKALHCKKIFSDVCKSVFTRRALSNDDVDDNDVVVVVFGTLQSFFIALVLRGIF